MTNTDEIGVLLYKIRKATRLGQREKAKKLDLRLMELQEANRRTYQSHKEN